MMFMAISLAFAGFTALSLSMQRHHRDLFGRSVSHGRGWGLRVAGYSLLAVALWLCVEVFDAPVGIVIWIGILSTTAVMVAALLALKRRSVLLAGFIGPVAIAALLLVTFGSS